MTEEYMIEQDEVTFLNDDDIFLVTTDPEGTPESNIISWESIKTLIDAELLEGLYFPRDGWIADTNTWSYSSADSPTFVISVNADMTSLIGLGDRIKLTQTTDKYFIVTKVGSYSGGNTLITVYGGTDYTLPNATISNPKYSHVKSPFGFPMSPSKWMVSYTNSTTVSQASPTANTWYNLGGQSISVPIGDWKIEMEYLLECSATVTGSCKATLSTSNNSESNSDFSYSHTILVVGTNRTQVNKPQFLTLTSKTTYYLNAVVGQSGQNSISLLNAAVPTTIKLYCAYL